MKTENPTEPFKRAVASAVRSLAGEPELEVNFSAEPPALKGLKARLPLPARNLSPADVAIVRGQGDAYALRRAYHEDAVHEQYRPQAVDAAAVFEAAEQARVEAIGALAMKGVADNLEAQLEARCAARGLAKASNRSEAPIADAVGLLIRERLTGAAPPECARNAVDLWRPWIEERAGIEMAKLDGSVRDQKGFAKLTRAILKGLELGEDFADNSEGEGSDESGEPQPQSQDGDESADASTQSELADAEMSRIRQ